MFFAEYRRGMLSSAVAFRGLFEKFLFIVLFVPCFLVSQDATKICLTMIVKNESSIIERCLTKTQGFADCICICDTGSTDNTVEIVENYLEKNKIPGKVYKHAWKNFGHNRTLSVKAAQEMLPEVGFSLESTYLLLLDADMLLIFPEKFDKQRLTAGGYLLKQVNGLISYDNMRLIRASLPWDCVGPTHEYWRCTAPHTEQRFDSVWIDDRNDGGCKSDKFERDIRLLTQGLIEEPGNVRYIFYLAQSYMCSGKYDEAIGWYKKRIEKGGFAEEVWYSKYMIGDCYLNKNDWDSAFHWYLEAFADHPARAEPLKKISAYYLQKGRLELAYLFSKKGVEIPYPADDILFVEDPVYDYGLDEDLSIAAYYCKNGLRDGLAAVDRLILKKTTPEHIRAQAYNNLRFYVPPLSQAAFYPIKPTLPQICPESSYTYAATNPCIQKTREGYLVLCRSVNYKQKKGVYQPIDPQDPKVKTRNFLLKYSKDLKLISQKEILDDCARERHEGGAVLGLEDCRLVYDPEVPSKLAMLCTTYDTNPEHIPQQSYCTLLEDEHAVHVSTCTLLQGPSPERCEKNWLPFFKDGRLNIVYSHEPFVTYAVDEKTGICTQDICYDTSHQLNGFRGSARPIPFDNGYLSLVHEVIFPGGSERIYTHRFVYLDKGFRVKEVSRPFTFRHTGVEFSCGMTLDHGGKNLIIGCGIEDKEAFLASVDVDTVVAMLYPLP
jgi:glycosyltransferase involved in cell wall biosynthesis